MASASTPHTLMPSFKFVAILFIVFLSLQVATSTFHDPSDSVCAHISCGHNILVKLMQIAVTIISHAAPESAQRKAASIFLLIMLNT